MLPCKAKDAHSGKTHAFKFSERQRNSNFGRHDTEISQVIQPPQSLNSHARWMLRSSKKQPHTVAVSEKLPYLAGGEGLLTEE